jgi:hypothetical protein
MTHPVLADADTTLLTIGSLFGTTGICLRVNC